MIRHHFCLCPRPTAGRHLLAGVCAAFLLVVTTGCGKKVHETLHVPGARPQLAAATKNIVLLPFADYSYADNLWRASRRNMTIAEALTDRLVEKGFGMPVQEDVFKYLVDNRHVKLVAKKEGAGTWKERTKGLERELDGGWSSEMKSEIVTFIRLEQDKEKKGQNDEEDNPQEAPGVHGLDRASLARIGSFFGARYILRGRIMEHNLKKEHSWEPWRRGTLPFIYGLTDRLAFGISTTKSYDSLHYQGMGSLFGMAKGFYEDAPFSTSNIISPATTETVVTTATPASTTTLGTNFDDTTSVTGITAAAPAGTTATTSGTGSAAATSTVGDNSLETTTAATTTSSTTAGTTTTTTTTKSTPTSGGLMDSSGLDRLFNSMIWGSVGAQTGQYLENLARMLDKSHIPQAVVQLRVWLQDAASGQVVWTNRVEVKVSPETIFADDQVDGLFDTAIERAVSRLVEDMAANLP